MHAIVHKIKGIHAYAFGSLRGLYDWVLSWGHTKYGSYALFVLAFVESSFFPIPPDVLQICLSVAHPKRSFWFATIATIGSVLGGFFGYLIGAALFQSVGQFIINALTLQAQFDMVGVYFTENAFLAILGAAFTPIPYKVFTIAAGFWDINLWTFGAASVIGRGGRFFLEAILLYFFGEKVAQLIDKYFNILSLAVFLLVVAGFIAVKYL